MTDEQGTDVQATAVVVDLGYGGTATHPTWDGWRTTNGELDLVDTDGDVAATFAANHWSRVYVSRATPTITTPPSPFAQQAIYPGQAF